MLLPLSPWLLPLLAGEAYATAVPVLLWLLPTLLFTPFLQAHRPILFAIGQQKWLLLFQIASLLTYAPLLWWLIGRHGAVGAAQVLVINGLIHVTLRLLVMRHTTPHLWISPLTLFRVEAFDRKLMEKITARFR